MKLYSFMDKEQYNLNRLHKATNFNRYEILKELLNYKEDGIYSKKLSEIKCVTVQIINYQFLTLKGLKLITSTSKPDEYNKFIVPYYKLTDEGIKYVNKLMKFVESL